MRMISVIVFVFCGIVFSCNADIVLYPVQENGLYGYINEEGVVQIDFQFTAIGEFSSGLCPVKIRDKWGYCNVKGDMVIEPLYNFAYTVSNGFGIVGSTSGYFRYININTFQELPFDFYFAEFFSDNLAMVGNPINNEVFIGFINEFGIIEIHYQYDFPPVIGPESIKYTPAGFRENICAVWLGDGEKIFFIDKKGNVLNREEYDSVEYFQNGIAKVSKNGKHGLLDSNGNYIVEMVYDEISVVNSELIAVAENEKYGFINKQGEMKIPLMYDYAESFTFGLSLVGKEIKGKVKYGYIDKKNKTVIPYDFESAYSFDNDGFAVVRINGNWGVINSMGEYVVIPKPGIYFGQLSPLKREGILNFRDYVQEDAIIYYDAITEKQGYIKIDTKMQTEPLYFKAFPFNAEVAKVQIGEDYRDLQTGYLNSKFQYIWKPSK